MSAEGVETSCVELSSEERRKGGGGWWWLRGKCLRRVDGCLEER